MIVSGHSTVLNKGRLTGGFDPAAVTNAVFESEVMLVTPATFIESGTITFGNGGHRLNFAPVGEGWMGKVPIRR